MSARGIEISALLLAGICWCGMLRGEEATKEVSGEKKSEQVAEVKPETKPAAKPEEIAEWIKQLEDRKFAVREEAERRLSRGGVGAVKPLKEASIRGPLETTTRAIRALEGIFEEGDDEAAMAADEALSGLVESQPGLAGEMAADIFLGHSERRDKRALAAIEKLGGVIGYDDEEGFGLVDELEEEPSKPRLVFVMIPADWKWGDAGLRHLDRLSKLPSLYVIHGSNVSREAINDLAKSHPNMNVHHRGQASLGVQSDSLQQEGCEVSKLTPGSAAEKAGIMPQDVIVKANETEITSFADLVEFLQDKKPGEKVTFVLERYNHFDTPKRVPMTIEVVLDDWSPLKKRAKRSEVRPAEEEMK